MKYQHQCSVYPRFTSVRFLKEVATDCGRNQPKKVAAKFGRQEFETVEQVPRRTTGHNSLR